MINNIELINFIDLSLDEKKMILKWRNHQNIKSVMHNNLDISIEEHLKFIDSLHSIDDKKYFLVKEKSLPIGVIDFNCITDDDAELGIYTNPELRGYGSILLNEICKYALNILKLKKLKAEVYNTNNKAIKLYKEFNFKEIKRKNINDKEIIFMELKL